MKRFLIIGLVFCLFHCHHLFHRHARACGGVAAAPVCGQSFAVQSFAPMVYAQPAVFAAPVYAAPVFAAPVVVQQEVVRAPRRQVIVNKQVIRTR